MLSLSSLFSALPRLRHAPIPVTVPSGTFGARFRTQIAPRKVKYAKRQKGRIPIPTGGSTRGTTLAYGEYGIRIKGQGVRFTAKQLMTAEEVIKRAIKVVKGAKVYMRVFPDIPVCIKVRASSARATSVELNGHVCRVTKTRMGKGKGTFEFWATSVRFSSLAITASISNCF
jgi:ribosomal protein L16